MITVGVGDDSTDNAAAINAALAANDRVCIRDGIFQITESIILNTNNILVLKDCEIKLVTNIDNAIRNADLVNGNSNIKILCVGNVIINHNGTARFDGALRPTYGRSGAESYKYNTVTLYKVDDFEIYNLCIKNSDAFGFLIENCSNGIIRNIKFDYETATFNQDGIHLVKSHDIDIDGIYGLTQDDFFAITAFLSDVYGVNMTLVADAYNITAKNIEMLYDERTGVKLNSLRILNGDGCKIYHIRLSNIITRVTARALLIGNDSYPDVAPLASECTDIIVDNIRVNITATKVIYIDQPCSNITVTNLTNTTGTVDCVNNGDKGEDITVNGVEY